MISSTSAASVTGFVALFLGVAVFAGQLHLERFGLKEVAASGDRVYVGVVESVTPPKNPKKSHDASITLKVEKVFGPASGAATVGATIPLSVYGGVIWDDPHKSPIDRRLDGGVGPKKGDRVLAVPSSGPTSVELLPATDARLRTASILWDAAARTTWLASPDGALAADLANADLATLALAELEKRGTLTAAQLLGAEEQFLFDHVREMPPEPKLRFLTEATPLAKADPAIRDRLFRLAIYEPRPQWIAAAAPLIAMYDPTQSERPFGDLHLALVIVAGGVKEKRFPGPLDLSPFADFLIAYEKHRPRHQSTDDDLPMLTSHLNPRAKAALAVGFVESARSSTFANGEYDNFLLYEAARLAKEAPDASLVGPMSKIDPTMPRVTSEKQWAMGALLQMGAAIVAGVPAERERVQHIVQPWIDQKVAAPKDALALYLATVGEP